MGENDVYMPSNALDLSNYLIYNPEFLRAKEEAEKLKEYQEQLQKDFKRGILVNQVDNPDDLYGDKLGKPAYFYGEFGALDPKTGMRTVQLYDKDGNPKIGYTTTELPEIEVTGNYGGSDQKRLDWIHSQLYSSEYDKYFDNLPEEDKRQIISYLNSKYDRLMGVPTVYDPYAPLPDAVNKFNDRKIDEAYELTDIVAPFTGYGAVPYFLGRTSLDLMHNDTDDALWNATFAALPAASRVGKFLAPAAEEAARATAGSLLIGAPSIVNAAENGGPDAALKAMFMYSLPTIVSKVAKSDSAVEIHDLIKQLGTSAALKGEAGMLQFETVINNLYKKFPKQMQRIAVSAEDLVRGVFEDVQRGARIATGYGDAPWLLIAGTGERVPYYETETLFPSTLESMTKNMGRFTDTAKAVWKAGRDAWKKGKNSTPEPEVTPEPAAAENAAKPTIEGLSDEKKKFLDSAVEHMKKQGNPTSEENLTKAISEIENPNNIKVESEDVQKYLSSIQEDAPAQLSNLKASVDKLQKEIDEARKKGTSRKRLEEFTSKEYKKGDVREGLFEEMAKEYDKYLADKIQTVTSATTPDTFWKVEKGFIDVKINDSDFKKFLRKTYKDTFLGENLDDVFKAFKLWTKSVEGDKISNYETYKVLKGLKDHTEKNVFEDKDLRTLVPEGAEGKAVTLNDVLFPWKSSLIGGKLRGHVVDRAKMIYGDNNLRWGDAFDATTAIGLPTIYSLFNSDPDDNWFANVGVGMLGTLAHRAINPQFPWIPRSHAGKWTAGGVGRIPGSLNFAARFNPDFNNPITWGLGAAAGLGFGIGKPAWNLYKYDSNTSNPGIDWEKYENLGDSLETISTLNE